MRVFEGVDVGKTKGNGAKRGGKRQEDAQGPLL